MKNFSKLVSEKLVINKEYEQPVESKKINNPKDYVGKKIRIISMEDPCGKRYEGKEGEVKFVDDMGQLHGTWGGLAVIPEIDNFIVIDD